MFTEVLNPFIYVRNRVKNRRGEWVDERTSIEETKVWTTYNASFDGDTEYVVFEEWDKKIVVESMILATDAMASPHLLVSDTGGDAQVNVFRTIQHSSSMGFATANRLNSADGYHDYLELAKYDTSSEEAMILLKRPIVMGHGGKFVIRGNSGHSGTVTAKVVWREIEV